jgi:hypothetical protein
MNPPPTWALGFPSQEQANEQPVANTGNARHIPRPSQNHSNLIALPNIRGCASPAVSDDNAAALTRATVSFYETRTPYSASSHLCRVGTSHFCGLVIT